MRPRLIDQFLHFRASIVRYVPAKDAVRAEEEIGGPVVVVVVGIIRRRRRRRRRRFGVAVEGVEEFVVVGVVVVGGMCDCFVWTIVVGGVSRVWWWATRTPAGTSFHHPGESPLLLSPSLELIVPSTKIPIVIFIAIFVDPNAWVRIVAIHGYGGVVEHDAIASFPLLAADHAELRTAATGHVVAAVTQLHHGFTAVTSLPPFFITQLIELLQGRVFGTFFFLRVESARAVGAGFGLAFRAFSKFAAGVSVEIDVRWFYPTPA